MRYFIWDAENFREPSNKEYYIIWNDLSESKNTISVPKLLEENSIFYRSKFLEFISDLGEKKVKNKSIIEWFCYTEKNFSYYWMGSIAENSPFKTPEIYEILKLFVLSDFFANQSISEIIYEGNDYSLHLALRNYCLNKNIKYTNKSFKWSLSGTKNCLNQFIIPFAGLFFLFFRIFRNLHFILDKSKIDKIQEDSTLIVSHFVHLNLEKKNLGIFYSHQWEELPELLINDGEKINWLHLFIRSKNTPDARKGIEWKKVFNNNIPKNGHHTILESFIDFRSIIRIVILWISSLKVYWNLGNKKGLFADTNGFNLYPFFEKSWKNSISGENAVSNFFWKCLFHEFFKKSPSPKRILFLYENQGWEQGLLFESNKRKIPTYGVQHATVPFWHLYYFHDENIYKNLNKNLYQIPEKYLVNSSHNLKLFSNQGISEEKLVLVEALRYNNLSLKSQKTENRDSKGNVLILGDMIESSMFSLLSLLHQNKTRLEKYFISYTLKPHPGLNIDYSGFSNLSLKLINHPIPECIENFEFIIVANSTSAVMDAMILKGNPFIHWSGKELNLNPLKGFPEIHFFSNITELEEQLKISEPKKSNNFFCTDLNLSRWKKFLGIKIK